MTAAARRQAGRYTVYIAGPITGKPGYNVDVFAAAERHLTACGHTVVNPTTLHEGPLGSLSREEYMRTDIRALLDCEAIYLLPGWQDSRGARMEHDIAVQIGLVRMWPCAEDVAELLAGAAA